MLGKRGSPLTTILFFSEN